MSDVLDHPGFGRTLAEKATGRSRGAIRSGAGIRILLIAFAVWTVPAVLVATDQYFHLLSTGKEMAWARAFLFQAPSWYLLAAVTPLIVQQARRWSERSSKGGEAGRIDWISLLRQVPISLAVAVAFLLVAVPVRLAFHPSPMRWNMFGEFYFKSGPQFVGLGLACYWLTFGAAAYGYTQRNLRQAQAEADALQIQNLRTHLALLQAQVNPHFLFNSLNTIASLIRQQRSEVALAMLERMTELLHALLEHEARAWILLSQEVELACAYLEIERERLGDRLSITIEVDKAASACSVPALLLQPLVENAVRHGVAPLRDGGQVKLRVEAVAEDVLIKIENDAPAVTSNERAGHGLGLANTRARLQAIYGERASLRVESSRGEKSDQARHIIALRLPQKGDPR